MQAAAAGPGCGSLGEQRLSRLHSVAQAQDQGQVVVWSIRNGASPEESSLVAQLVKNLPAMQETWVRSLGWEDPLEEGMAADSSIFAWRMSWTEEPQTAA